MKFSLLLLTALALPSLVVSQAGSFPVCLVCGEGRHVSRPNVEVPSSDSDKKNCGELETLGNAGSISPGECAILPAAMGDICCKDLPGTGSNTASPLSPNKEGIQSPTPAPTPTKSEGSVHDANELQARKDPNEAFGGGAVSKSSGLSGGGKAGLAIFFALAGLLAVVLGTIMLKKKSNSPKTASTVGLVLDPDGTDLKLEQGGGAPVEDVALTEAVDEDKEDDGPSRIII